MLTTAPEPGAKPQSGLSVIRSGARYCSRPLDARDDGLDGIDLPRFDADAAEPDLEILAQRLEHVHVAGSAGGEFQRQVVRLQPVQLIDDRLVAALELRLAAHPRAGAAAQVDRKLDVLDAVDDRS